MLKHLQWWSQKCQRRIVGKGKKYVKRTSRLVREEIVLLEDDNGVAEEVALGEEVGEKQ